MVFCSLCKSTKECRQNWIVNEHGADSTVGKFKVCDDCASFLLRGMYKKVHGVREDKDLPDKLKISKTGVITDIVLEQDGCLEMTIGMDISKARRLVEKQMSGGDVLDDSEEE